MERLLLRLERSAMSRSLLCFVLALGCSSENDGSGSETAADQLTFYEDVAPIVYENCVGCHRPGTIAPFSLIDYTSAHAVAANMALATAERIMPPMPVDNSGACNTYSNARWLTDDEIAIIGKWAETGAAEGNPANAPPLPEAPAGITADVTLDMGVTYTPNDALEDDYRCFVLPAPVDDLSFVTAYEVLPGDSRVVHHIIVYQPNDDAEAERLAGIDDGDPGDGYTCFGGPGVDANPLVLWAPGASVVQMPPGTGTPLFAGRKLVMQVHYNLKGGSFPDRTAIKLKLEKLVMHPSIYFAVADLGMRLTPGLANAQTTASFDLGDQSPFVIYGALPHMHTLGRTLHVEIESGAESTCVVDVDRWDFHWQNAWWYDQPLTISDPQRATITCGYDTSDRTEPVTWGEGTLDEMCLNYAYVSAP